MSTALLVLLLAGCTIERRPPLIHQEEGYIVPPGTELLLTFGGEMAVDVAVDHDAPEEVVPVEPPIWRKGGSYRAIACSVTGRVRIENRGWTFHEVSVRVEPSPSPLCPSKPRTTTDPMAQVFP